MSTIHVGIDIGTSSAKICATQQEELLCEFKQNYNFPKNAAENGLQDPKIILETVTGLLEKTESLLNAQNLKIDEIWTCGQMHGIVLWSTVSPTATSSLYNWTYSNPQLSEFLKTLPKWHCGDVHPGFGISTLAFLNSTNPEELKKFDRCGTIMEFFLSSLSPSPETFISHQNAHSWGYCTSDATWQSDIIDFLPNTIQLPTVTRDTQHVIGTWHGAKCHVASGDLQASVASLETYENTAYVILGTSAQLCCLIDADVIPPTVPPTVVQLPYSMSKKLLAACAMNGGNALEAVLKIQKVNSEFSNLPHLLEQLNENAPNLPPELLIDPIFIPERGISRKFQIHGLTSSTSELQILEATHLGIIRNLFSLFPISLLKILKIRTLALVGSAQSARFLRHIQSITFDNFQFKIPKSELSAPFGAIKFANL